MLTVQTGQGKTGVFVDRILCHLLFGFSYEVASETRRRRMAAAVAEFGVDLERWARLAATLRDVGVERQVLPDTVELRTTPDSSSNLITMCDRCIQNRCHRADAFEREPVRLSPAEALELIAISVLVRERRIDTSTQSRFLMLQRQRRALDASALERAPGDLVTSSGRAPRGPNAPRTTQVMVSRGELLNAA